VSLVIAIAASTFLAIGLLTLLRAVISMRQRVRLRRIENAARDRVRSATGSRSAPRSDPSPELVELVASGDCVLFAGPILSSLAGVSVGRALLQQMVIRAENDRLIDNDDSLAMLTSLRDGQTEAVADELAHFLERGYRQQLIANSIGGAMPGEAHFLLAKLAFREAISMNYDKLLETALQRTGVPLGELAHLFDGGLDKERDTALPHGDDIVIRLRGGSGGDFVVTDRDLRRSLTRNKFASQYLSALFLTHGHLFIGMTLQDIRGYLETVDSAEVPARRHFAFVREPIDDIEARFLSRRYNLEVTELRREDMVDFLRSLERSVRQSASPKRSPERPVLDRLRMENIGPFVSLDLPLQEGWNVLLGNNGMGKSIVLRAVATAVCGDLVEERLTGQLLRTGAHRGFVELRAGSRTYRTELERGPSGYVHVASSSPSPLLWEDWLVLGFPALRSMTADRPSGPAPAGIVGPLVDDVMPLLTVTPDTRLSDLKQWLIDLDYAAGGSGAAGRRAGRTRDRFFEVLDHLMPDIGLALHRIDKTTRQIEVRTKDSIVPIEAISQGTAAVMAWVGTLLERLYEVGGEDGRPEDWPALVLIDEIDAHMHPEWQRVLVERLRDLFPNVQVLATTHSPLIVGSMDPKGIMVARRDVARARIEGVAEVTLPDSDGLQSTCTEIAIQGADDRQEERLPPFAELLVKTGDNIRVGQSLSRTEMIQLTPLEVDLRGWRADQILTGPAFDLNSARDTETERIMDEYTRLAALDDPTDSETSSMQQLGAMLGVRVPTPLERSRARDAFDLIQLSLNSHLAGLPRARQNQLVEEIKVQLQESETGSRRPR
jgi:hypothetical protein